MHFKTLNEALRHRLLDLDDRNGRAFYYSPEKRFIKYSYSELLAISWRLRGTIEQKVLDSETVILFTNSPFTSLIGFYACVFAHRRVIIMPYPKSLSRMETMQDKVQRLKEIFGNHIIGLVDESIRSKISSNNSQLDLPILDCTIKMLTNEPQLETVPKDLPNSNPDPSDIVYYQMTSGSTGSFKCVPISNENILHNVEIIHYGSKVEEGQMSACWIPVYHDMGLIGSELYSLCYRHEVYLMSPFDFLKQPHLWLQTISNIKATLAPSPNFGFEYVTKFYDPEALAGLDLSSWTCAYCGSEPIRIETFTQFFKTFSPHGFRKQAFLPCYGLAESTLAVTFKLSETANYVVVESDSLKDDGHIKVLHQDEIHRSYDQRENETVFISVGEPLPGMQVELFHQGEIIKEDLIKGEMVVRGKSVISGYITNANAGMELFDNETLNTGDIAFRYRGEYYVIDRMKNILIVNGENYASHYIESLIARHLNFPLGSIVVFESNPTSTETEFVAILEGNSKTDAETFLKNMDTLERELPFRLNKIILTKSIFIPRTSSGKKMHFKSRQLYESGQLRNSISLNQPTLSLS